MTPKFTPTLNTNETVTLEFNNPILQELPDSSGIFADNNGSITSTQFTFGGLTGCSLRDNGSGVMQVVQQDGSTLTIQNNNIGSIDYTSGTVKLTNFNVSTFIGDSVVVSAMPLNKTLSSDKNLILTYNKTPSITIVQERI